MDERQEHPEEVPSPTLVDEERFWLALSTAPRFVVWEWDIAANRIVALHDEPAAGNGSSGELFRWVHGEDRERLREAAERILAGEALGAVDFRIVGSEGQERWCSFRARRRCGADGRPTHLCGITVDITDLIFAAEEASRAKDEFLAMLGHELRTPLTPASALVQLLVRDQSLAPEHRAMVAEVGTHISSEKRLIESLLDYECLVHDAVQLRFAAVDIHEQARHALAVCAPLIRHKRLGVLESFAAAHPVVHGDALRLRQVLWNVVQNAVKFTPQDGKISVRTANPEPGVLVLEVEDSGAGIEPGMLRKIFEGFERGGRRPDSLGGLGLGLAISRGLVELHGGTLTAASPGRGGGSTFTLRLATAGKPDAVARTQEAPPPDAETPGADRPLHLLLVEDHPPSARAIVRLLKSHGHTVQAAGSLDAAERAVAAERFDLLICDLQLPEGSGLDLLPRLRRSLRQGEAETPAIVLSGFVRESDVARSLAAGFVEHLAKPVDQDQLLAAIRRVTAGRPLS